MSVAAPAETAVALDVVDAAVHVVPASPEAFLEHLPEPWRSRRFPGPDRYHYALAAGEHWPPSRVGEGPPGSDPATVVRQVLDEPGAAAAVLVPLTRGLHPNTNLAAALCAATNDWLAACWLDAPEGRGRLYGTIRVDPRDVDAAVREVERWAGHPAMVQVAVPTQAWRPYGQVPYLPLWQAAARHGLPVLLHVDGGSGVDFPATPAGNPRLAAEHACLHSLNQAFHLASLIVEGAFTWVEGLTVVLGDGGFDVLWPLLWRLDKDWKGNRDEVPAARQPPSAYLRDHVRLLAQRLEGPAGDEEHRAWLAGSALAGELLLFASNYPQWDHWDPAVARHRLPAELHRPILADNARALYGIPR